jgi:hypothetical protein
VAETDNPIVTKMGKIHYPKNLTSHCSIHPDDVSQEDIAKDVRDSITHLPCQAQTVFNAPCYKIRNRMPNSSSYALGTSLGTNDNAVKLTRGIKTPNAILSNISAQKESDFTNHYSIKRQVHQNDLHSGTDSTGKEETMLRVSPAKISIRRNANNSLPYKEKKSDDQTVTSIELDGVLNVNFTEDLPDPTTHLPSKAQTVLNALRRKIKSCLSVLPGYAVTTPEGTNNVQGAPLEPINIQTDQSALQTETQQPVAALPATSRPPSSYRMQQAPELQARLPLPSPHMSKWVQAAPSPFQANSFINDLSQRNGKEPSTPSQLPQHEATAAAVSNPLKLPDSTRNHKSSKEESKLPSCGNIKLVATSDTGLYGQQQSIAVVDIDIDLR